jgi:excisionase family DNA binding protein
MPGDPRDTAALFVRIPQDQARALDRLAFESRRPKQAVVSELLGRYIDGSPARRGPARALVEEPVVGWHSFRATQSDVLTLEGVAELLEVASDHVAALAAAGELPGRLIGGEWRFARSAVLAWLAHAPVPDATEG